MQVVSASMASISTVTESNSMTNKNRSSRLHHQLPVDSLWQQTADQYTSTRKVQFRKILSVTLTSETNLNMSTVSRGSGNE